MDTFSVYHPYGKVGALPWQARGGTAFGDSPRYPQQLLPLVDQIKTFTERVEDEEAIADIRRAVSEAELVVFLGFAFHPQNMALLKPTSKANAKMVLSTGYDLSATDCKVMKQRILELLGYEAEDIKIHVRKDFSCRNLFDEYGASLSSG